jgi:hypothetical protein
MIALKKIFSALVVALLLCAFIICLASVEGNREKSAEAMEQTILRLLFDPVYNAIKDYYGEARQYWKDELLSVQRISAPLSYYEVVMQVETFCGPHSPPFGVETMTFHISYGKVELKSFVHQDKSY